MGEGGDEGSGEGALGKEVAEEVGDTKGGDEGIELFASAEEGVEENFADEPEDSGGSDGQHDAGGAFGAHFCFNLWTHADKTSSGVRRVIQRRRLRVTMNWAEKHSALETCIASSKSPMPKVKARCKCSDPVGGTIIKDAKRRIKGTQVGPPK